MKKTLTLMLLGVLLATGSAFAAEDPVIGTWKLNTAKSKFKPGPGPKEVTRVYSESGGLYTLDQKGIGPDGKDIVLQVRYRDGQEEKRTGDPNADSTLAKRLDARTWDFDVKKDGKVVSHVHRVVATDGKSMVVHETGKHADGKKFDNVMLFVKQ